MSGRRVLIIGGGIGGLAAATALARNGDEVTVAERHAEFVVPGVGLGQPANGLRALERLGVLDACAQEGFAFHHLRFYDYRGEPIVAHRFLLGDERLPAFIALSRRALHESLNDAALAAGVTVRMGTRPVELDDNPAADAVRVVFEDGGEERYDLVAGFDGNRSWTRNQLLGDAHEPVYSGYTAWRMIVPRPEQVTSMEFYQGLGHKTGLMPLSENTMYLFNIRPEPEDAVYRTEDHYELLMERLASYSGLIGEVRDRLTGNEEIVRSPLRPLLVPSERTYRGRVVIGGDAAHTYPPHMTQGAAMALEDAVVLADALSGSEPLEQQLADYVARRKPRCQYVAEFAGGMLAKEQDIQTEADLDRARTQHFPQLDERMSQSDLVMNEPVVPDVARG